MMNTGGGTLTHFSLCSGIGGIDLAAEWAGFKTVGQSEIDDYASKVLAKNFKGVKNYGDIRTVTAERLCRNGIKQGAITVLSAGIPCQPYSLAGKGLGDSDSRDLEQELIRVVGELQPRWVLVENTPGLFSRKNQRYFDRILTDISALGYSVGWGMWGACDVGAPHRRERVFIVAHADSQRRRIYETNCRQFSGKVSKVQSNTLVGASSVCGEISDTACERRSAYEIQLREPLESSRQTHYKRIYGGRLQPKRVCSLLPYTTSNELGVCWRKKKIGEFRKRRDDNRNRAQRHVGGQWWETEPNVGRVVARCPARVDRLRGLGNMVVPQQVYPIFKAIADYESI